MVKVMWRNHLPNKRQRQTPRKSSTNTRALSTRIHNIQKELNPIIKCTPLRTNPEARTKSSSVWVARTVRVTLASATEANFTIANVAIAAGVSSSAAVGNLKILGIKVWNYTGQANSSNYLRVTPDAGLTTNNSNIIGEDWGNSSSLPGVKLHIPDLLATTYLNAGSGSSASVLKVTGLPTNSASVPNQTFLAEFQCMLQF